MESLLIFWSWWRDHLLAWLPGHAERRSSRASDGMVLGDPRPASATADASIAAVERRGGVEQDWGRVALSPDALEPLRASVARNRLPIVLRLPGSLLLERDVTLPIAAERDLNRVLYHEMDRFTPFTAAEVLWTYLPRLRDRAHGKLTVRLAMVQRDAAAPLIASLAEAGLTVAGVELPAADGEPRRILLDEAGAAPVLDRWRGPALGAIAALGLLAIALPFLQQGWSRAAVERRIAATAPVVAEVRQLRAAAATRGTGSDVIAAERKRAGDALEAIALLTDALPDGTYLTALTFDAGKLTMDGQSKSAAALIAPLTVNQRLQDASFTAPVVRNALGLDNFSLGLRVTR